MKKIGKKWLTVLLCLTAIFAIFGFAACGEENPSGGGKTEESAVILSVDGASIDGLDIFMFVDKDTDSVSLANKVVCSDDSIWKLYYDKLGQVEIPTKIAADISGELLGGDNLFYIVVTSQNGEQVNVYEMNVYRSYAIDVCYYNGNKRLKTETAYTGYEFTTDYVPNITGYTFNGWNYTPKVLWDNLKLYADKTANTYTVTYDVNGGDELTTTEKTVTYDSDYTFTKPTRTGYTFLGWYYGETQLTDGNGNSLVVWNYAKNLTAKAKWQVNEYAVTLKTNNSSAGTVTGAGNYAYDSNVTIKASTNSGYTWLGWYNGDMLLTDELSYTFTMKAEDVTYTAKWTYYTVTTSTNLSGAGTYTTYINKKVTVGTETTLTVTTNRGYTWLGWYNGDTLLTTERNYTFTMPAEDTTYTAKWNVSVEMSNFSFSSSATTCTISGVKDNTVTEIVVPNYVTTISSGAFSGCSSLTSITLPFVGGSKSATGYEAVFGYIFGYTTSSSSSTISGTTYQYYEYGAGNTYTYYHYYIPASLKEVTITGGAIGSYAFRGCNSLTSITIPDSVTSIGYYAFSGCVAEIKWGDNPAITSIGEYAFSGYEGTSITIPDSVTRIGERAFFGCVAEIKWGDNPTITGIGGYAFSEYKGKSITLPDSVTSIGGLAFYNCSSLTSITLPFVGGSKLATGYEAVFGYIFGYTTSFSIAMDSGATCQYYNYGNDYYYYYIPASLKEVTITGGAIGDRAFYNCSGLTSVVIGDGVTSIGYNAFSGCSSLTSVVIPDSVTRIGDDAFYNCSSLTSVVIPDSVTRIGEDAFVNCSSLTSITIPDGVTSIGSYAFRGCNSLTSITILDSVTSIGYCAFSGCVAEIKWGDNPAITSIGEYAFSGYEGTSITIPDGVTSIGNDAFSHCSKLTSITIPDSVTSIGYRAFGGCSGLTSITIPEGVTSIDFYVFGNCDSLTSITIPDSVTSIGDQAFFGCSSLTSVYYKDTAEEWAAISINSSNGYLTNATRYYYIEKEADVPTDGGKYWHYDENGEIAVW